MIVLYLDLGEKMAGACIHAEPHVVEPVCYRGGGLRLGRQGFYVRCPFLAFLSFFSSISLEALE